VSKNAAKYLAEISALRSGVFQSWVKHPFTLAKNFLAHVTIASTYWPSLPGSKMAGSSETMRSLYGVMPYFLTKVFPLSHQGAADLIRICWGGLLIAAVILPHMVRTRRQQPQGGVK